MRKSPMPSSHALALTFRDTLRVVTAFAIAEMRTSQFSQPEPLRGRSSGGSTARMNHRVGQKLLGTCSASRARSVPKHEHEVPADRKVASRCPRSSRRRRTRLAFDRRVLGRKRPGFHPAGTGWPKTSAPRLPPANAGCLPRPPRQARERVAVALLHPSRSQGSGWRSRFRFPAMASSVRAHQGVPDPTSPRRRLLRNVSQRPSRSRRPQGETWCKHPAPRGTSGGTYGNDASRAMMAAGAIPEELAVGAGSPSPRCRSTMTSLELHARRGCMHAAHGCLQNLPRCEHQGRA